MTFEISSGNDLEDGTYKAQLARTEVRKDGQYGDFRVWHWIVDKGGETVEWSDSTSLATGPGSKTFARLTALTGRVPVVGEKIEEPTGKTVVLTIGRKKNGFGGVQAIGPYVDPQTTVEGLPR